jgi:hypothetical protein
MLTQTKIFISYSSMDREIKARFDTYLSSLLQKKPDLRVWSDKELVPGMPFQKEIFRQLRSSDICVLLVSEYFLASDFCFNKEFKEAIQLADREQLMIVSVILRACNWKGLDIENFHVLPDRATPLEHFEKIDEAYKGLIDGLEKTVDHFITNRERTFEFRQNRITDLIASGQLEEANNVLLDLARDFDDTPDRALYRECSKLRGNDIRLRGMSEKLLDKVDQNKLLAQLTEADDKLTDEIYAVLNKLKNQRDAA